MKTHICRTCGTQQEGPRAGSPSSFGAEVVVLVVSCVLAWISHWAFLLCAVVFSGWRYFSSRPGVCEKCKSADVIPVNTPVGRQLAEQLKVQLSAAEALVSAGESGRDVGRALGKRIRKLIS